MAIDFQLPSVEVRKFRGLNDQEGIFSLHSSEFSVFDNGMIKGGAARRRFGYARRITAAITGASRVTGIGGFTDIDLTRTFVAVSNGKLYEDVSGTWTERSTGTPFDATIPAIMTPVGRNIVITDQTNNPRIWNGSGAVDTLNANITKASCVGEHRGYLFVGSPTVTGTLAPVGTSTRQLSSVLYSADPSTPTSFPGGKSDLNLGGEVLSILSTGSGDDDLVLFFLDSAIWYARYAPSVAGAGSAPFTFAFNPLDPGTGIVNSRAICRVPGRRIFFWGRGEGPTGPYMIGEKPVTQPIYIGKRIETFISGIDSTQLDEIAVFQVPGQKCVLFNVPYGTSQATNNYAVYYNWDEDAFAIFKGSTAQTFAFASGASVLNTDGTTKCYAGDYAGVVYEVGTGLRDDGEAIETTIWTPWYGGGGVERKWLSLVLNMLLAKYKTLEVRYRLYGKEEETSDTLRGGATGDPIGTFAIGVSPIAGQSGGRLVGDIYGDSSEYIQFGIIDAQDNVDFVLYGLQAFYEKASSWAKAS